jgi:signal peptidase I
LAAGLFAGLLLSETGCHRFQTILGRRAYVWQSESMEKTIYKGDTFLCNADAYKTRLPERGDVIVFHHGEADLAKRVIGLPGDRIEGKSGRIIRNGQTLSEPYAEHVGEPLDGVDNFGPVTVAPKSLFLLGDNRNHSLDSRMEEFGVVKFEDVIGKAESIIKSDHGTAGTPIR